MDISKRTLIIITIGIVFLIIATFGAWFWYISNAENELEELSIGRGLTSFVGGFPTGSTYSNVVDGIIGFLSPGSQEAPSETAPRLWKVADTQVAGIYWTTNDSSAPVLHFITRSSGNIFRADPQTSRTSRLSNTVIPKISEAIFINGDTVFLRSSGEQGIETSLGEIVPPEQVEKPLEATDEEVLAASGPGTLETKALERGMLEFAASPSSDAIFYILPYEDGTAGYVARRDGTEERQIWTSSFFGWKASWVGDHILLVQKGAYRAPGTAYDLYTNGSTQLRVASVEGLSALESSDGKLLFSTAGQDGVGISGIVPSENIIAPPFATLAEKCVWSSANTNIVYCAVPKTLPEISIPDAWYRGEYHFSDSIWRFDTQSGSVSLVYDPEEDSASLDILNPTISLNDSYIGFIDANTGEPWVLRINN